jgi:hypothetical protein
VISPVFDNRSGLRKQKGRNQPTPPFWDNRWTLNYFLKCLLANPTNPARSFPSRSIVEGSGSRGCEVDVLPSDWNTGLIRLSPVFLLPIVK